MLEVVQSIVSEVVQAPVSDGCSGSLRQAVRCCFLGFGVDRSHD